MKITRTAAWLFLSAAMVAAPATAYAKDEKAAEKPAGKQPKISSAAEKEIVALDKAVKAKDAAAIPGAIAAAEAKMKTADDKYVVGQLTLKSAIDTSDKAGMVKGLTTMLNSEFLPQNEALPLWINLGRLQNELKQSDAAATTMEKVIALDPNNLDALTSLSDIRNAQGRYADSMAAIKKAIAIKEAAGAKADVSWYRRATALAYNNKLPGAADAALAWVSAYPTKDSWRDALRIYQSVNNLDAVAALDVARLQYTVGALASENDYYRLANALVLKGYPGEAKTILDAGFAAGTISKTNPSLAQLSASANTKSAGDRASLAASAKTAMAAPAAKQALSIADAYFGYGDYPQAIELYRAALGKTGADKDLVNLHLGMALARSGDKAGATAALTAVGGAQAAVAKMWLAYVNTMA